VCKLEIEVIDFYSESAGWEDSTAESIEVDDGANWRKIVKMSLKVLMW
jgi:hypothetical protein